MIKLPACNVPGADMAQLTYDQAEYWAREGLCSDAEWQRYRCVWRNGAYRFSNVAYEHDGHDPATCPYAEP